MSASKPPSVTPHVATPPAPRTKSGELAAVQTFQDAVARYNDETVPKLDEEVDRMNELLKSVTPMPATDDEIAPTEPMPPTPRTPSMVDLEEVSET